MGAYKLWLLIVVFVIGVLTCREVHTRASRPAGVKGWRTGRPGDGNVSQPCHHSCLTCFGPNSTQCLTCPPHSTPGPNNNTCIKPGENGGQNDGLILVMSIIVAIAALIGFLIVHCEM